MKTTRKNQIHEGPKPDSVTIDFLGLRSPKPLWVEENLLTSSPRYNAIKSLNLPVTRVLSNNPGIVPDRYIIYLRDDKQFYDVYQILGRWPSIYGVRQKIVAFMEKNSVNLLP